MGAAFAGGVSMSLGYLKVGIPGFGVAQGGERREVDNPEALGALDIAEARKVIQNVDLNDNRNLFTVSVVLIAGVGGLVLKIGPVTITAVACALILGILTNLIVNIKSRNNDGALCTLRPLRIWVCLQGKE